MKFKLVEKFDETRSMVQEYMYDAMDELNNASLEEYIQWFKSELTYYDDEVEQAVTDAYIEACDYGMLKGIEKTRITSELKEYIESHIDIIDGTDELMRKCPEHLQHELKIVLSKLDESLNEGQSRQQTYANKKFKNNILKNRSDKNNFLVHHLDDDRLERAPRSNIMIKVTDYTNSIFVPKMSVNQNIPHELITACKKLGGFDALMKELNNLNVLHVDEQDNITEQSLLD